MVVIVERIPVSKPFTIEWGISEKRCRTPASARAICHASALRGVTTIKIGELCTRGCSMRGIAAEQACVRAPVAICQGASFGIVVVEAHTLAVWKNPGVAGT